MPTILEEFENKAKNLPLKDRAALIESLISCLDELDDTECEELWAQEADKRYQAYKAKMTGKPVMPATFIGRSGTMINTLSFG